MFQVLCTCIQSLSWYPYYVNEVLSGVRYPAENQCMRPSMNGTSFLRFQLLSKPIFFLFFAPPPRKNNKKKKLEVGLNASPERPVRPFNVKKKTEAGAFKFFLCISPHFQGDYAIVMMRLKFIL